MISIPSQARFMALILTTFVVLFSAPYEEKPLLTALVFISLFPVQTILWRLGYSRKVKDFFFCLSFLIANLILKHYWQYADLLFYATAILVSAVLRYRIFLAVTGSAAALEVLRENYYGTEGAEEVAFRYVLFLLAGTLTYILLWEEKRKKEEYKKELDDLKYGIQEVSEGGISDQDQISRSVDAAIVLDESLSGIIQLVHNVFKPETSLLWQFLPEQKKLRVKNRAGDAEGLRDGLIAALGEGPIGWAALNKKTFLQQNRQEGVNYFSGSKKSVIRSLLAVPILDKDRLEGVLSVESEHLNYFAEDAEKALSSFAAQIAQTIRMARLAKEREERAIEFQAFYRASKELASTIEFEEIVNKLHVLCAEIVPYDFSAVAVWQEPGDLYSVYQWASPTEAALIKNDLPNDGRSWISWFLNNREEPFILTKTQLNLQQMPLLFEEENLPSLSTFLAAPMRHQQQRIGALLLGSKQEEAFSSHQARVVSILCNQAAVSLENSSIIQKMEELAITDGLTGLFNHRYFQEAFQRELERAERQNQKLTLLIMDIDHFKGFNDSFGHPAGDFILKSLAQVLKKNARKIDVLARYGGEEFAALLPGIDKKNARKTAERWRRNVQRSTFKSGGQSFAITLSIGFATYPEDGHAKIELIEKADRGLYDAKENGRNQVRHVDDH
ncbi:diguanylate cyclase [bacterium]|nr:diguanylate cyclase [bacterium]